MDVISKLSEFIEDWEGGLSRKRTDSAHYYPSPWKHNGLYGWHTNKGVTYATFESYAPKFGYSVTSSNFFQMPNDLWFKILKDVYAGGYPLEKINHLLSIQAVIITWAWGSGLRGSERRLANFQRDYFGVVDSNITKNEIVENFNKYISVFNESEWFEKLCDRRLSDFKKMSGWRANGRGWTRRLADFRKRFKKKVQFSPLSSSLSSVISYLEKNQVDFQNYLKSLDSK